MPRGPSRPLFMNVALRHKMFMLLVRTGCYLSHGFGPCKTTLWIFFCPEYLGFGRFVTIRRTCRFAYISDCLWNCFLKFHKWRISAPKSSSKRPFWSHSIFSADFAGATNDKMWAYKKLCGSTSIWIRAPFTRVTLSNHSRTIVCGATPDSSFISNLWRNLPRNWASGAGAGPRTWTPS